MKYLFLGLLCDRERESEYIANSRRKVQGAVNAFQWNLLDGFAENGTNLTVLNTMPVGIYPKYYSQLFLKKRSWHHKSLPCREVGFVNLPVIKQVMRKHKFLKETEKWIRETNGEKAILAYSLYVPFLQVLNQIKKKHPDVQVSVLVTDLPGKFGVSRTYGSRFSLRRLKGWYDARAMKLLNRLDSFVLLTEQMKVPLEVGKRPYVVVEGICRSQEMEEEYPAADSGKKAVLYTGSLNPVYGILDLVEAFRQTEDPNYELWICGAGEGEAEIRRHSEEDPRIAYKGFVSKQEVFRLQAQAALLVNPRKNEGEYTKYSFPSKTMEYMVSGTPVLMYWLDGMPEEYRDYAYFVPDNKASALGDSLEKILTLPEEERRQRGKDAREFMRGAKNGKAQARRILDLLDQAER